MTFTNLWCTVLGSSKLSENGPRDWSESDRADCCRRPVSQTFGTILKPWRRGVHLLEDYHQGDFPCSFNAQSTSV